MYAFVYRGVHSYQLFIHSHGVFLKGSASRVRKLHESVFEFYIKVSSCLTHSETQMQYKQCLKQMRISVPKWEAKT